MTALDLLLGRPLASEDFGKLDLGTLLGLAALLQVKHDVRESRTFVNITNVMAPPKGTPARLSANGAICFSFEPFDRNTFEALPGWIKNIIQRSPEYLAATRAKTSTGTTAQRLRGVLGKGGDLPHDEITF